MILAVDNLDAGYGDVRVLRGLALAVDAGEVLCLMGRNGAGKSTALKAIMGLVPATAGTVRLDGTRLDGLPAHEVPRHGVAWVPQGRRLFAELTVAENLEIGLMTRDRGRGDPRARRSPSSRACASACPGLRHPLRRRAADARDRPRPLHPSRRCCCSTSPPRACSPR